MWRSYSIYEGQLTRQSAFSMKSWDLEESASSIHFKVPTFASAIQKHDEYNIQRHNFLPVALIRAWNFTPHISKRRHADSKNTALKKQKRKWKICTGGCITCTYRHPQYITGAIKSRKVRWLCSTHGTDIRIKCCPSSLQRIGHL
jgi:hypothetical protein